MSKDKYTFSLDGIASEKYLNKKGFNINFKILNHCILNGPHNGSDYNGSNYRSKTILSPDRIGIIHWNDVNKKLCIIDSKNQAYRELINNKGAIFINQVRREHIKLRIDPENATRKYKVDIPYLKKPNTTELDALYENPLCFQFTGSINFQLYMENKIFFKKEKLKKYKLYKIILDIHLQHNENKDRDYILSKLFKNEYKKYTSRTFNLVYYGITERDLFHRLIEHEQKAVSNSGYFFHKAWHKLLKVGLKIDPLVYLVGHSDTKDEIYDMEESFVQFNSLYPMGCNSIPGGHAGIKELHKLNLLGSTKNVSLKERDKAIQVFVKKGYKIKNRKLPIAHTRGKHVRRYRNEDGSIRKRIDIGECKVKGGAPL